MLLIAVIIGYLLGIAPFVAYFLWKKTEEKAIKKQEITEQTETQEMLYEYFWGKQEDRPQGVDQQGIFQEYITGKEAKNE